MPSSASFFYFFRFKTWLLGVLTSFANAVKNGLAINFQYFQIISLNYQDTWLSVYLGLFFLLAYRGQIFGGAIVRQDCVAWPSRAAC
jgi:hypothetical protein